MVSMVLGKLYLPLSLRGDEGNIGKLLEQEKKNIVVFNMTVLWGYERYWKTARDTLSPTQK
jgi:hypothetical protein